ncbi:MAG: ATP-binding cassette domain-containing protein [Planctomycetaceae bacterium]|nr:ATP-binding cassette domain-containing protein [Planctomycetaceae bacterium]
MPSSEVLPVAGTELKIVVRGLRVHNLQDFDLEIPLGQFVVVIGVSGSGKSSLAHHTLYVEGQRRFNETLSPQLRQLLGTFQKPDADEISQLPPTITLRELSSAEQQRVSVGSLTEIDESLALLFARRGEVVCPDCEVPVHPTTPESVLRTVQTWPEKCRYQIAFRSQESASTWREAGFVRTLPLSVLDSESEGSLVIVDRLTVGGYEPARVLESLETAFNHGNGEILLLKEPEKTSKDLVEIERREWESVYFSSEYRCPSCRLKLAPPHPQLFHRFSAYGKCDVCGGAGSLWQFSIEKLIPDETLTLRQGVVALTQGKSETRLKSQLEKRVKESGLPTDLPLSAWEADERTQFEQLLLEFLTRELESRSRFKSDRFRTNWMTESTCSQCSGTGYAAAARAVRLLGENFLEWQRCSIRQLEERLTQIDSTDGDHLRLIIQELLDRIRYLLELDLDELTLNRMCATLSSGERKLVQMAGLLAVGLVNTLYILDEPSRGLHPRDQEQLIHLLRELLEKKNSLLIVDHAETFWQSADQLIELGPGPGVEGGRLLYQGAHKELSTQETPSGQVLSNASHKSSAHSRRTELGRFSLKGVGTNNLKQIDVEFPLNGLTVVSGISGSGKSSLVEQTLYPAVAAKLGINIETTSLYSLKTIEGVEHLEQVIWVDPHRKPKNSRSVVATALKVFSLIRQQFAETVLARTRDLAPGYFSFNTQDSGRCEECEGKGTLEVDMAFMEDLSLICPQCEGKRFRPDLLEIRFRGLNLDEVLNLSATTAFEFFRKLPQIQKRLQVLMELGLGYLELGRPLSSLSLGEQQRLHLAELLLQGTGARMLFLLDEPTSGLHPVDVGPLLDYFERMLEVGHTLVVIDNHAQLIDRADHVIELGPGRGSAGGEVL